VQTAVVVIDMPAQRLRVCDSSLSQVSQTQSLCKKDGGRMATKTRDLVVDAVDALSVEELRDFVLNVILSWFWVHSQGYTGRWDLNKELRGSETLDDVVHLIPSSVLDAVKAMRGVVVGGNP
jgi:hypothetical protein